MVSSAGHCAFVAGATGYTGREVVQALCRRGVRTIAHVRPESASAATWRERFAAQGAEVDLSPWRADAIAAAIAQHRPTHVFALLGTTRKRAAREGLTDFYEKVDYGLTAMLLQAAIASETRPRFVYLSALGVSEGSRNPYIAVRARLERELAASGLPALVVRPAFITGPDREESRLAERLFGAAVDGVLAVAGALGARTLRDRWGSLTGRELAEGMVTIALREERAQRVIDPFDIRRARESAQ